MKAKESKYFLRQIWSFGAFMIVWIVNAQIHEDTAMHDQKIVLKADHKFLWTLV